MKNIDRFRMMSIEDIAKGRINFQDNSETHGLFNSYYTGDFSGRVEVEHYLYSSGLSYEDAWRVAYNEAIRLEIEWLNKEEEDE